MKALFSGLCTVCWTPKPRCAWVRRGSFDAVLCGSCRRDLRGRYTLDERHKPKVKAVNHA